MKLKKELNYKKKRRGRVKERCRTGGNSKGKEKGRQFGDKGELREGEQGSG